MKTKSKSLISIILSIMMVLSMVIVAVPVNAATVDNESTGTTTYYLYYGTDNNLSGWSTSKRITLTDNGDGTYSGSFSGQKGNNFFTFNTSTSAVISKNYWDSNDNVKNKTTISGDNVSACYGQDTWVSSTQYFFTLVSLKSAGTINVTFKPSSTMNSSTVSVFSGSSTPTTYTVSTSSTSNGSFTVSPTSGVSEGDTVTINTTPNSGYKVNTVTVTKASGGTVSVSTSTENSKYTFEMPASNVTVAVTFTQISYTITKTTPVNGTFKVSATTATSGTSVTVSDIVPTSGYEFESISVKDASNGTVATTEVTTGSNYTFTMPASNVTVTVTFKQSSTPAVPYNITVSTDDTNGTVSCDTSSATVGTTVTFTITPNSGYAIDAVTVTGTEAIKGTTTDGTTTYTFTMPEHDVTISATFVEKIVVSSAWSLVGDFNDWTATENPMRESTTGTYTTSLYLPENSTGFEFKILDNESTEEHKHYSKVDGEFTDVISNQTLDNSASVDSDYNIVFKTTGGVYTFTWVESSKTLNVTKGSTYTLTASDVIPDTIGAGEDLNMTINTASTGTVPTISYYKYTVKAGSVNVVKGVQNANASYACKTTLSSNTTITYFVKAYNADGELLGLTATGSKDVTVTVGDFTVDLSVDQTELVKGESATLSVTVTPSDYAGKYEFFHSTDGEEYKSIGTSTSASKKITPTDVGTNYYKVKVTSKYDASEVTSYPINVDVYESGSSSHDVTIYFKSASSFIYAPTIACNSGTAQSMTKDTFIGDAYSGSLKFYWYKATINFDSTQNNTITFKTGRTQVNASYSARFLGEKYYFAVDNLMADTKVYNLTSAAEYIRNFYHSPLNMVTMGDISDGNLGFTSVDGKTVKMGTYFTTTVDVSGATVITSSFSIKSATVAQKIAAELEEVSDTQYGLLDVNLDGVVDVRDATLMQKALVYA